MAGVTVCCSGGRSAAGVLRRSPRCVLQRHPERPSSFRKISRRTHRRRGAGGSTLSPDDAASRGSEGEAGHVRVRRRAGGRLGGRHPLAAAGAVRRRSGHGERGRLPRFVARRPGRARRRARGAGRRARHAAPRTLVAPRSRAVVRPWRSWPPAPHRRAPPRAGGGRRSPTTSPTSSGAPGPRRSSPSPSGCSRRAVVDYVDLPSRNRRELAAWRLHRIGRRIAHDGGVDASVFGLARDVQGGFRSRWVERYVGRRAAAVDGGQPDRGAAAGSTACAPVSTTPASSPPPADEFPVTHFVFPGSFLYPPHQDAAEWFALYVLPPLRKLLPACRIVFAGEYPDWMPSFGELHGIEVTGRSTTSARCSTRAPSSSPRSAPGRARSSRSSTPGRAACPSSPRAARSRASSATDGDDVLVADDPAEFAARCSMAARYPELRATLAGNGRARYEAEFTWPVIGADLVPGCARCVRGQLRPRLSIRRTSPNHTAMAIAGRARRGRASGTQRRRVEHLDVLEAGAAARRRRRPRRPRSTRGDVAPPARRRRPRRRGRAARTTAAAPVAGVEAHVAARHRQAVGLAHDRRADDLDAEVEVARHPADDRELLEVLLAEHRDVGRARRRTAW